MSYDHNLENILEIVLESPRDFYIKIYNCLSPVEKENFKKVILNKTCMNCTNGSCKIEYYEKNNEITSCIGWENSELLGKQRVLMKKNERIYYQFLLN